LVLVSQKRFSFNFSNKNICFVVVPVLVSVTKISPTTHR